jgi:prepilin-type N-terminal cleavage/methylation domain-containing protein
MNRSRQIGFTLWELLVTILVAGVLFGIGVPNFMEFQRNSAMSAAANDLITAILTGRIEAVKRQAPVAWCLSDDPLVPMPTCLPAVVMNSATRGFVVWVDENNNLDANGARILTDATDGNAVIDAGELILTRGVPPGGTIRVSTNCGHIQYLPTGFPRTVGVPCNPAERIVLFCDDRGRRVAAGSLSAARVVVINRLGRAQVLSDPVVADPRILALVAGGATCP